MTIAAHNSLVRIELDGIASELIAILPRATSIAIVEPIDLTVARYFASAGWSKTIIPNSQAKSSKKSRAHSSTLLDQTCFSKGRRKLGGSGYDGAPLVSSVAIGITSAAMMIS